jgi:hypothetical protein
MFLSHMGQSAGGLIKYVSCYRTVLIRIHVSGTHHDIWYMQPPGSCMNLSNCKIFQNLKLFKIFLPLNIKLYIFVLLHIVGCHSPGVCCYTVVIEAICGNAININLFSHIFVGMSPWFFWSVLCIPCVWLFMSYLLTVLTICCCVDGQTPAIMIHNRVQTVKIT